MAIDLVVEDGSGVEDANTYVDVETADEFFTNRNESAWTGSADQKAAALIKAAQYLQTVSTYKGVKAEAGQALKWPRDGVYDEDGYAVDITTIPQGVINAQLVLARYALSASLLPDLDRGGQVRRERVGELEVEYFPGAPPGTIVQEAWAFLREWVQPGNQIVRG